MKNFIVTAVLTFATLGYAGDQPGKGKGPGKPAASITGRYQLSFADDLGKKVVTIMTITSSGKNTFFIQGVDQRWAGVGRVEGTEGFYHWTFDDGKTGRTTFTINPDGSILGNVVGSGQDWRYLARRQ